MKILVLGGGPAGLYFSLLAKQHNPAHQITVLERNPRGATWGWGVVFSEQTLSYLAQPDPVTFAQIDARLERWQNVDVVHGGEHIKIRGNHFSGIARIELLTVLQRRCEELGVELRFGTEVHHPEELPVADLVVASDGIRSILRAADEPGFGHSLDLRPNRYIWLGTRQSFDALTLTFRANNHGLFIAHSYRFSPELSTFIVECDEESWRAAGLDQASEDDSRAYLEGVFADDLGGHALLSNQSRWIQFATVRNDRWSHNNVVLVGDAAHTAHFSIGSGTKLALEGAIALAQAFAQHGDNILAALAAYEAERRPKVEKVQRAAQASMEWFENAKSDLHLSPLAFAFKAMTRSDRVGIESLKKRDPEFVARAEAAGLVGG